MAIQVTTDESVIVEKKRSSIVRPIFLTLLIIIAAAAAYYFWGARPSTDAADAKHKKDRPAPVNVAIAKIQNVPIEVRSIGNVLPYSVVNIIPQVGGQLQNVYFTQGQFVKKGQLLFQIDPRTYQATLDQTLGNVARDQAQIASAQANLGKDQAQVRQLEANVQRDYAQAKYASAEMARYGTLVQQGAVSKEQSEQMNTNAATSQAAIEADKQAVQNAKEVLKADAAAIMTARGTLKADQAAAQSARIMLGFTQIRSPLDGRTGSLNVYQGNVVSANSPTPLVVIDQVKPIYVTFTLPEQNLDQVRRAMADKTLKVQALIEGRKQNLVQGTVSFLENTVNTSSGTVSLRATFPNLETKLFPGQFVDVIVTMPPDGQTIVVPSSAVQTSQQGNSVYVVKPNKTVDFVTVELKRSYGDMAAIGKGLSPGDVVVTDGQLQLTPGARVEIQKDKSQIEFSPAPGS